MPCLWAYQFPIAFPNSYWAQNHLAKENYRLDIQRRPNQNGALVYSDPLEACGIQAILSNELYNQLWQELSPLYYETRADDIHEFVLNQFEDEMSELWNLVNNEDPTCQAAIDEFVFLGRYAFIEKEAEFLTVCRDRYGIPINESMLECMCYIIQEKWFLVTFRNLVIVTKEYGV